MSYSDNAVPPSVKAYIKATLFNFIDNLQANAVINAGLATTLKNNLNQSFS